MTQLHIKKIPYRGKTIQLFDRIANLPWAIYLDSCHPNGYRSRYDVLSAAPKKTLVTRGAETCIQSEKSFIVSKKDPFALLREALYPPTDHSLPFATGAMGYWGYDLGRRIETLPSLAKPDVPLPDMCIGIYNWSIVSDHLTRRTWLCTQGELSDQQNEVIAHLVEPVSPPPVDGDFRILSDFSSHLSRIEFQRVVQKIKEYFRSGDCHWMHLAQRFALETRGDPWQAYCFLREKIPANYAAFFRIPYNKAISCFSPELFLHHKYGRVHSKVVHRRFTDAPPHTDPPSPTLITEHRMILDALRNDFSRNCQTGSVLLPDQFEVDQLPGNQRMSSTVAGQLSSDKDPIDLLRGAFPGSHVTGSPKIRAMELIDSLEPNRRNLHAGSIGYIDHNGNMNTNLAVQTLIHKKNQLFCYSGTAISADTQASMAYQETIDQVAFMLNTLRRRYF